MNIVTVTLRRLPGFNELELSAAWIKAGCVAAMVFLLAGCQVSDMVQFSYANATASHHWVDGATTTSVQFELVDDHIIVPVAVNGSEPMNFVVDSGAAASVIFESRNTRSLSLELGAELALPTAIAPCAG